MSFGMPMKNIMEELISILHHLLRLIRKRIWIPVNNRFSAFHDELLEGYAAYLSGDRNLLFRMKELWTWWSIQFPGQEKILKQIKKTNNLKEYQILVKNLLDFLE